MKKINVRHYYFMVKIKIYLFLTILEYVIVFTLHSENEMLVWTFLNSDINAFYSSGDENSL